MIMMIMRPIADNSASNNRKYCSHPWTLRIAITLHISVIPYKKTAKYTGILRVRRAQFIQSSTVHKLILSFERIK